MAFERNVFKGYKYIFVPLGFSGTNSRSHRNVTARARRRATFCCEYELACSRNSPARKSRRSASPRAKPACRLTQRTVSGRVHHNRRGFCSDRSRSRSQRLVTSSETICGRTPQIGAVAQAPQSTITPEEKGSGAERRKTRKNATLTIRAKTTNNPPKPPTR